MAVRNKQGNKQGNKQPEETGFHCPVCKEEIKPEQQHCKGSTISFYRAPVYEVRQERYSVSRFVPEWHHGVKHDRCWKCEGDMGCSLCVPDELDLFCRRCKVAANLKTLLEHGVPAGFCMDISGHGVLWTDRSKEFPKLQDYPKLFVNAYVAQCIRMEVPYEGDGRQEWMAFRAMFEKFIQGPKGNQHGKAG